MTHWRTFFRSWKKISAWHIGEPFSVLKRKSVHDTLANLFPFLKKKMSASWHIGEPNLFQILRENHCILRANSPWSHPEDIAHVVLTLAIIGTVGAAGRMSFCASDQSRVCTGISPCSRLGIFTKDRKHKLTFLSFIYGLSLSMCNCSAAWKRPVKHLEETLETITCDDFSWYRTEPPKFSKIKEPSSHLLYECHAFQWCVGGSGFFQSFLLIRELIRERQPQPVNTPEPMESIEPTEGEVPFASFISLKTEIDSLRTTGREVILLNLENPKQELSFDFFGEDNWRFENLTKSFWISYSNVCKSRFESWANSFSDFLCQFCTTTREHFQSPHPSLSLLASSEALQK